MMLTLLTITVVLQLTATTTDAFLSQCGFNESIHIEDDRVADVLHTFHKDLIFVQAVTQVRQKRDYGHILTELRDLVKSEQLRQQIEKVVELLGKLGHFKPAIDRCNREVYPSLSLSNPSAQEETAIKSYLYYLKAEAYRLMGNPHKALEQISEALVRRQESQGVSINDLQRSNGLIEAERVSRFNQEVDKLFGLNRGPNFRLLKIVYSKSKSDTGPLKDRKTADVDKGMNMKTVMHKYGYFRVLDDKPPPAPSESTYVRVNPEQDDFSGQSIAIMSAKGILCEFAQKLVILGMASKTNYTTILDEIRLIDTNFARKIEEKVVKNLESGNHNEALLALNKFKTWNNDSSQANPGEATSMTPRPDPWLYKIEETYVDYFKAEIYRRTKKSCIFIKEIGELKRALKHTRQTRPGVSVGKILELEGKVVLLSMKCFHKAIRSVYELVGSETAAELATKRSYGRERIVPFIRLDR